MQPSHHSSDDDEAPQARTLKLMRQYERYKAKLAEEVQPRADGDENRIAHQDDAPTSETDEIQAKKLENQHEPVDEVQQHSIVCQENIPSSGTDEILPRVQEQQQPQASKHASSLLLPLTKEKESIVQNALYGIGPRTEILASSDTDSVQRASMQRL